MKDEESLKKESGEQTLTENTLRSFEKAIEAMQLGITITDINRKIIYTNPAEADMHGYTTEELIGKDARIFAPSNLWQPMAGEEIKKIKSWHREAINIRKNGSTFPVRLWSDIVTNAYGEPIGIATTCEDITFRKQTEEALEKARYELENKVEERTSELAKTIELLKKQIDERKKLESQLIHSQKMEAIGQLAGGVAHDFNNILTAIIGYANIIKIKMEDANPLRPYTEQILASAERAANLTQRLLAFGRKQVMALLPVKLNDIAERIKKLLSRLIGEHIELKVMPSAEILTVMADSGQIEQVLINLATNARDAMPDGGVLTISTSLIKLNEEYIRIHRFGKIGTYALLTVTDTGKGMDEKTKGKIFEPFFTTKDVGKGTGLGLAIVYGIVKQHNGYITCHSESGKGTTFMIYLPTTQLLPDEIKTEEKAFAHSEGTETILMAEDDSDVRHLTKAVLEEFGYKVVAAEDGEDAVNKFMANKDIIDLLLFDVIMPKQGGTEAYEKIRKIKPGIKVLFESGYTSDFIHKKDIIEKGMNFIAKPVSPTNLLRKVREVLDK